MFRYILPVTLIGIAIAGFFTFTNPFYENVLADRKQVASYNEALDNSKALEAERDKLTQKYNSFDSENLSKLQKLLPDNVDNIRLILEIEQIAAPYGMILKGIKYSATDNAKAAVSTAGVAQRSAVSLVTAKDYGIWDLEFSTTGIYNNFLNFTRDLENNLRIVDIISIQFSSISNSELKPPLNPSSMESYKYNFKIRTYWLKD